MVFDFRLGRGRDGPKAFLGNFEGLLQTDGYAAYDKVGGPKLVHAACWAHARRKFFEAHQVCPSEIVAKDIVLLIDQLFGIDGEARAQDFDLAARDALRQQQADNVLLTNSVMLAATLWRFGFSANWISGLPEFTGQCL